MAQPWCGREPSSWAGLGPVGMRAMMTKNSDKTMFEIYREPERGRRFRVVFFTELGQGNKESEISRAMAGEHVYDGFLLDQTVEHAKRVIASIVDRLNAGEQVNSADLDAMLAPFSPGP